MLDEVDNLVSRKDEIIYDAFNWPNKFPGRVIVIGIFLFKIFFHLIIRNFKLFGPHRKTTIKN